MKTKLIVFFSEESRFEYSLTAEKDNLATSREWLMSQYQSMECEPRNPVGKVLMLDVILQVAEAAGSECFKSRKSWASKYVQAVADVMDRVSVRVDIPSMKVG